MPLRTALWDLDDTLFDYTGSDRSGVLRHLRTAGLLTTYGGEEAALAPFVRQAVLSNAATANQERMLAALGIRTHFEAVFCADELGHAKPAAEAFKAVCQALGLNPGEVVHIGDKLDIDALGARDAGLTAVWLDRAGTGEEPPTGVHQIVSPAELPELLRGVIGFGAPSTIR
ncbi:HAD family hydrolase [Streptomyces tubercidicus]